jgi:polysaccharide pyruvyl transferase WcaK-like protein
VSWFDTDKALMAAMGGMVELAATRYAVDAGARWEPGMPLKLLLAGYAGSRNTGADVRVEEMIRQFRHLLGDDHLDLSILTIDPDRTQGYFRTVKQLHFPKVFPRFVFDTVHQMHGVIACEGSMFKSKFANALSTLMVGALGVAGAEQKLAIGYGGEAGAMDPTLEKLVKRYCRDSLCIVRNEQSAQILCRLGVPNAPGTDTAWTYDPGPIEAGETLLRNAGWDGNAPVLVLCPINPFWWPVKPDLVRGAMRLTTGAHKKAHYASVYFHTAGAEVDQKQDTYLSAIAEGTQRFTANKDVFTVCVGMEMLDRSACEALSAKLGGVPVFVSDEIDHWELVSVLRRASMLLSSRYHAIVCSMPGSVPSAGITMDERIRNLMIDRGTPELALTVDQPDLADRVAETLSRLHTDRLLATGIDETVARNLIRMGEMGQLFVEAVRERHPDFPLRAELGKHGDPMAHLPSLTGDVARLVRRVRSAA